MSSLADIGNCEPYRSLCHDMDSIRPNSSDHSEDTPRECEWESDLLVSKERYRDKVIRRDDSEIDIWWDIIWEIVEATSDTIDLSIICIGEDEDFFHSVSYDFACRIIPNSLPFSKKKLEK